MSRKLATLERIADIREHPNADALEIVKVRQWDVVVKKGEFSKGSPCVYFEVDSLLPADNPVFEFLSKSSKPKSVDVDGRTYVGYRLKTIRLRGTLSQGLALPLDFFSDALLSSGINGIPCVTDDKTASISVFPAGHDVSELLGIVKYEQPIPANLSGEIAGSFPSLVPKTDEERVQNIFDSILASGVTEFYATEKIDGTSATYVSLLDENDADLKPRHIVCSRNWSLKESEGNVYWTVAHNEKLFDKLPVFYAVQGEIAGPGIQGNPLKLSEIHFYVYSVYDVIALRYLDFAEMQQFCSQYQLTSVPIIFTSYSLQSDDTVETLLNLANRKSAISPECDAEGLVLRPLAEKQLQLRDGSNIRFSFKVISNNYLLDHE